MHAQLLGGCDKPAWVQCDGSASLDDGLVVRSERALLLVSQFPDAAILSTILSKEQDRTRLRQAPIVRGLESCYICFDNEACVFSSGAQGDACAASLRAACQPDSQQQLKVRNALPFSRFPDPKTTLCQDKLGTTARKPQKRVRFMQAFHYNFDDMNNETALLQNLAGFLLMRGNYSWFGYGFQGCSKPYYRPPELDADYGTPLGE